MPASARVRAALASVLALLLLIPAAALADSTPGLPPATPAPGPVSIQAANSLQAIVTETGQISWSLDGLGTNDPTGGTIRVQKPAGATVRRAFLAAATIPSSRVLVDGDVKLDGNSPHWTINIPSSIGGDNVWAEVTSIVKPKVDAAAPGIVNFHVDEVDTFTLDGEGLFVIFDDPNTSTNNTIALLFGAQQTTGDTFFVRFAQPLDTSAPGFGINLSLGISFGFQPSGQGSLIDVNSQRLSSCAGGQDDGQPANGALMTVGGIGDIRTPQNPNPNCSDADPASPRQDVEYYDLAPFVHTGDQTLNFHTLNPSNDDNIFFAGFFVRGATAVVGEGIVLAPASATNPVGTPHTLTATVQDNNGNPVSGRTVTFTVLSGPNAGTTGTAVTGSNGNATFTYTSTTAGTDTIQASFVDSSGHTKTSNTVTKTWTGVTATNRSLALNGSTAYADVPDSPSLNITSDWTVETWFKDENPNGFNHDYVSLLNKGDISAGNGGESPYFITIGFKRLLVGLRSGFKDYAIAYDLRAGGVDPTKWHHVAGTFQASTRTLTIYLDGVQVASGTLGATSAGNTLPLQIGRNGPISGKYFMGKLDDTRIWNVVRSAADVKANMGSELSSAPAGLVANWKYDDPDGTTAKDSADSHDATLHGGAVFSSDVHP